LPQVGNAVAVGSRNKRLVSVNLRKDNRLARDEDEGRNREAELPACLLCQDLKYLASTWSC